MNRQIKAALSFTALFLLSGTATALDVSYPANDPWLTFHILPVGESVTIQEEDITGQYVMNQAEISTLEKGAEFWNTYLRSGSAPAGSLIPIVVIPVDQNDDNAAAISMPIATDEQYEGMTELAASVIHGYRNYRYNGGYAALIMVDRPEKPGVSWATGPILTLPKNGMEMNLSSTIAHEMFHALGVSSTAEYNEVGGLYPENKGYGFSKFDDDTLSTWDTLLRDVNDQRPDETNKIIVTTADETSDDCTTNGPCFVTSGNGTGASGTGSSIANWGNVEDADTNYPAHGGVYLTGDNILDVLESGVDGDAVDVEIHVPTDGPNVVVPGLPVNTWEKDVNDEEVGLLSGIHYKAEFSHIELQNGLMSHQNYRNWGTFMEAELAVLQDLGYNLDRRDFYGFSIYRNNIDGTEPADLEPETGNEIVGGVYVNKQPFFARTNGQYVTGKPNTSSWGIGLHIYGSDNDVMQNANLLADGFSGIGVRVDGSENTLKVAPSVKITANGEYGHGILFSYGKEQKLVLQGTVEATGKYGKAVAFDFGDNMLSNRTEYRGSYIRASIDDETNNWESAGLLPELKGALITSANITGSVTGSDAAIYIGPSSWVKNINIMDGASINGNIVSDWKPFTLDEKGMFGEDAAALTNAELGTEDLMTNLTFGLTPNENGLVLNPEEPEPDASFNATVKGNISGSESVDMIVAGGKLAVTGIIDVHSLETADDTVLSLTVSNTAKATPIVRARDEIEIRGALTYTFDPLLSGLNTGDVLTVLNAETGLTWAETSETFSLESVLDYYKFDYVYNQDAGTLGLKVTSAQSKQAGTQSSHAMTSSVISAVGNKIMGRLNGGSVSVRGNYYSGGIKGHSGGDMFEEAGLWGKALYTHAHKSGNNAFKADIYGGVIGIDGKRADEITLGVALAYSRTDGEAGRTNSNADTYAAYLYGKYEQTERLSYNLAAGYGVSRFDIDNTPNFNVQFANVQGYVDYYLGRGFTMESGVRYVFAHQEEYKVGATTFNAEDTDTLTGVFGGRYAYNTRHFGIQMNLAAIYDFVSDKSAFRATNRGASMYVAGERLHRFGGEAGIAATFKTRSWEFELGYDAQVRKDYNDQTVSLKAGYRF